MTAQLDTAALLNEHLPHSPDAAWYCGAGIPAKKLRNAVRAYGGDLCAEEVRALGDGTVFGSAKEGVLITSSMLYSGTTDGRFAVPLTSIVRAEAKGGWPEYSVEVTCDDGRRHRISTTCFEKQQERLVAFFNGLTQQPVGVSAETAGPNSEGTPPAGEEEPPVSVSMTAFQGETSIQAVNGGLRLLGICPHRDFDDAGSLFDAAMRQDAEIPLLKGYCRYIGFNRRAVDGVFLLSNRRLLLFSMESGPKIFFVEMTKRLLGAVPFPFFDDVCSLLLFSIPRSVYVALRGGRERMIGRALGASDERLLSARPPLRCVQSTPLDGLSQRVSQVTVGSGVWTGILSREFGVSFAPVELKGVFQLPKDLILPEYETLEPMERLLYSIRDVLESQGLGYRLDQDGQQLTLFPVAVEQRAAA